MSRLGIWQEKIATKRKMTLFRDFVKEIMSWDTLVLQKNHGMISRYPETSRIQWVVSVSKFNEETEGLISRWLEYDFSKNFFDNFARIYKNIPLPSIINVWSENCDFSETSIFVKNAYLSSTVVTDCENILYSVNIKDNSKNVLNSVMVWDCCENVYMSSGILRSSNIFYAQNIVNSSHIWFSTNLVGCHDCISCTNLENQSYHINNKQYSKDDYASKKEQLLQNKSWFPKLHLQEKIISSNIWSQNTTGYLNFYSDNLKDGIYNYRVTNGRNVVLVWLPTGNQNIYDTYNAGSPLWSDMYGVMGAGWEHIYMCLHNTNGMNNFYSILLNESSFCLGCVGLKNKKFCILNRQYTEDEWFKTVDAIFTQMENDGILWKFFPATLNPYYFNDTIASLFYNDFTKEEITKDWYLWRDKEIKVDIPDWAEVIDARDLDVINYDESILKKVIRDTNGNYYKIVQMEYDFLKKHNLPLPATHWLDRMKLGFKFN